MPLSANFEEAGLNLQGEYKGVDFGDMNPNITLSQFLEKFKRFPIISVTGPAGAGKTTISKAIADFYGAKIFRELPELNPYLALIGKTKDKIRDTLWFPNQSLFCTQDSAIIVDGFINASKSPVVFDFAITQTKAYGDFKLKGVEKENFTKLFEGLFYGNKEGGFGGLPSPDIVIEIRVDEEVIISRRKERGKRIDSLYEDEVAEMNYAYRSGFVGNHYENVFVFDNNSNMSHQDLIKKINDFLVKLSN